MFLLDKDNNKVDKIAKKTFSELGFKERQHLQEWIAKDPSVFGEDLLIIQKEFAGFSDTNERIDLVALDKDGQLVIIENKLDDSGKDVIWQALKYTSYCSSLSKENIRKMYQEYLEKNGIKKSAEEKISEFFENGEYDELILNQGYSQRIILVAANFRKEVTSTAIWLMNYKIRMQCFKVTPYTLDNQVFINFEQILPLKDAEQYMISMAEKELDGVDSEVLKSRHELRKKFWTTLLQRFNQQSDLYRNISPSKYSWIGTGSGFTGIGYNLAISNNYGRAEIYIDTGDKSDNESIFDYLKTQQRTLEEKFSGNLEWEKLDDKRACRIKSQLDKSAYDTDNWDEVIDFMVDQMTDIAKVFKEPLNEAIAHVKQ